MSAYSNFVFHIQEDKERIISNSIPITWDGFEVPQGTWALFLMLIRIFIIINQMNSR
jgi:hypothetical protein